MSTLLKIIEALLLLLGLLLVARGASMIYPPLGVILAGTFAILLAVLINRERSGPTP